jgi:tetratricopeptide (TPR) repeat protein
MARFNQIRVLPRAAVFPFRPPLGNLRQIAKDINASYLVQGTVARSGNAVNLVVSLVRGSDGAALWTNTYRRSGADVTDIEADVTAKLASSLGIASASTGKRTHHPSNPAHELYLKGSFESAQATVEANSRAQAYFRQAIRLDPEYVLAYEGLADAIWNQNIWANESPVMEERRKAEELWQKAVQLDPEAIPAHRGLAAYAMQYDWDWKRADRELQAAMKNGDNAGVEENYASLTLILGRRAETDKHLERALELDPQGTGRIANMVNLLGLEGRFDEDRAECEKWIGRNRNSLGPQVTLAGILAAEGKIKLALQKLAALPQDRPIIQMAIAQVKAKAGDRQGALQLLNRLEENDRDSHMFAYDFACAYAALGDTSAAARWMEKSLDAREGPALYIHVDPALAKVQNTAAFHALKQRMDLDW